MAPVAAKAPVRESVEPTTMGSPVGSPPAAGDSPAEPSPWSSAQAVRTMATATSAPTLASERLFTLHRVLSLYVSGGVDDRAVDHVRMDRICLTPSSGGARTQRVPPGDSAALGFAHDVTSIARCRGLRCRRRGCAP